MRLLPEPSTPDRARVNQWISFAVADLEWPLWRNMKHRFLYPEQMRIPAEVEVAHVDLKTLATYGLGSRYSTSPECLDWEIANCEHPDIRV